MRSKFVYEFFSFKDIIFLFIYSLWSVHALNAPMNTQRSNSNRSRKKLSNKKKNNKFSSTYYGLSRASICVTQLYVHYLKPEPEIHLIESETKAKQTRTKRALFFLKTKTTSSKFLFPRKIFRVAIVHAALFYENSDDASSFDCSSSTEPHRRQVSSRVYKIIIYRCRSISRIVCANALHRAAAKKSIWEKIGRRKRVKFFVGRQFENIGNSARRKAKINVGLDIFRFRAQKLGINKRFQIFIFWLFGQSYLRIVNYDH